MARFERYVQGRGFNIPEFVAGTGTNPVARSERDIVFSYNQVGEIGSGGAPTSLRRAFAGQNKIDIVGGTPRAQRDALMYGIGPELKAGSTITVVDFRTGITQNLHAMADKEQIGRREWQVSSRGIFGLYTDPDTAADALIGTMPKPNKLDSEEVDRGKEKDEARSILFLLRDRTTGNLPTLGQFENALSYIRHTQTREEITGIPTAERDKLQPEQEDSLRIHYSSPEAMSLAQKVLYNIHTHVRNLMGVEREQTEQSFGVLPEVLHTFTLAKSTDSTKLTDRLLTRYVGDMVTYDEPVDPDILVVLGANPDKMGEIERSCQDRGTTLVAFYPELTKEVVSVLGGGVIVVLGQTTGSGSYKELSEKLGTEEVKKDVESRQEGRSKVRDAGGTSKTIGLQVTHSTEEEPLAKIRDLTRYREGRCTVIDTRKRKMFPDVPLRVLS